ncbi:MAG TPA: hypothetical protein VMH83_15830 [Candidatus Acidoferrum sp.]|nr:hypothetical protein [Candidatus Acidoferrum sp.]
MRTLVIQSCSAVARGGWMQSCLRSVESWAAANVFDYRFVGDEIFELVPAWYLAKVPDKLPIATDYARLVLLQRALADGYDQALWLDADVLVLDPAMTLAFDGSCAFGQEVWVEPRQGRLQARRNVHNAVAVFRRGCPVLPFLLHCIESLMRRVDPAHIAPQFVGPKLLQALHPLADFALLPQVGALSPAVVDALCKGGGEALTLMLEHSPVPPKAVNLCASLIGEQEARAVIELLHNKGLAPP